MEFFLCDENKCRHDGICAQVCPVGILEMDPEKQIPVPVENAHERCIACGHCVAVCPHGAISLTTMPVARCAKIKPSLAMTPEQLGQLLKGRRSIRTYKNESVNKALIEELIDAARYAPSGINLQPVAWSVIYGPEKVQNLAGLVIDWMKELLKQQNPMAKTFHWEALIKSWESGKDFICRNAPHLVMAYGLQDDLTAPQAATIALTYFELAAAARELGTCWAGYVHVAATMNPAVKKYLGLRSREICLGAMLLGHPKYHYARIPLRNPSRIKWLHQ